jgi:adenylate kinase
MYDREGSPIGVVELPQEDRVRADARGAVASGMTGSHAAPEPIACEQRAPAMGPTPLQVILLGPPGAGKGTQAKRLAEDFGLAHINPGQILRERAQTDSPAGERIRALMAAGELAPDELIDDLVRERLQSLAPDRGFVLDGYPRTPGEAQALRGTLARLGRLERPPIVAWLDVPREKLIERLRRRGQEQDRPDDSEEAIARRLEIHESQAAALREALVSWTDVVRIDGDQPAEAVTKEIVDAVCAERPDGRSLVIR